MSGLIVGRFLAAWGILSLLATTVWAADPPLTDSQKIEQALNTTVEFDFNAQPLSAVVKSLQAKPGIKTYLDEKGLIEANIDLQSPVTFKIKGISLRSALRLLLGDLDLKYVPRDGVLWITNRDVADDLQESRVYAVRDLVAHPDDPADTARYDFNSLVDTIQNTVIPGAWGVSGPAPIETMRHLGALVILATYDVHEQIEDLLEMLRRARDQQFAQGKPKPLGQRNLAPVLTRGTLAPAIRKALAEKMNFSFDQKPLDEALEFIAKNFAIPVLVDQKALRESNVPLSTPVSLQAEGLSLRNGLSLLLRDLDLKAVIHQEVLLISTKDTVDDLTEVRLYPVLDLVQRPETDFVEGISSRIWRYDYSSLSDVIQNTVKPDSWGAVGGPGGLERYPASAALVVPQVAFVHDDIADLLIMLRKVRDQQFDGNRLKPLAERSWQPIYMQPTSPRIRQALNDRADFDEDKTPLNSVLKFVSDKWQILVLADWNTIANNAYLKPDVPVSINCQNCRLQHALDLMLRPHKLRCIVLNDALLITTQEVAEEHVVVRGYPISDLDEPDQSWLLHQPWAEANSLRSAIETNIKPASWNSCGGRGIAEYVPNARTLVVSQVEEVHQQIEALLTAVRQSRDQQAPPEASDPHDRTLRIAVYPAPLWWPRPSNTALQGLGLAGGMGGMGGPRAIPDSAAELVELIPQQIEPRSWQGAGGQGTIHATAGRLIVRQTQPVQEKIVRFLRGL